MLKEDTLSVFKGYFLNEEDHSFRNYILDISCSGYTELRKEEAALLSEFTFPVLQDLANDGLVVWNEREVRVSESGQHFIRNICAAFDLYLQKGKRLQQQITLYSKAI
jgi:oxygen-independent coproporphyrinogen-3 oxidase